MNISSKHDFVDGSPPKTACPYSKSHHRTPRHNPIDDVDNPSCWLPPRCHLRNRHPPQRICPQDLQKCVEERKRPPEQRQQTQPMLIDTGWWGSQGSGAECSGGGREGAGANMGFWAKLEGGRAGLWVYGCERAEGFEGVGWVGGLVGWWNRRMENGKNRVRVGFIIEGVVGLGR